MKTPRGVLFFLILGLVAASQSGNIIRLGEAHPVTLTFWRLALATVLLLPLAWRDLPALKRLSTKEGGLLIASGLLLAFHFFAWNGAVQRTTVANATILFALNPVLTATAAFFIFRERITRAMGLSILLGMAGVAVLSGGDLSLAPDLIPGDALGLLCAGLFSGYFLLARRLREKVPTAAYVIAVYGTAALVGLVGMFLLDLPLVDYDGRTWSCFVLLALVPTILGHTSFNAAIRYLGASRVATATLSEPLLAGIGAWCFWGEAIGVWTGIGYVLVIASVSVLVRDR